MEKHRKFLLFFSLLVLLFLVSCKQIDVPREPTPPDRQGAFVGKAVAALRAYPDWAAKPNKMFVYPEEIEYDDELRVKILDYEFIYRFGYYFNTVDGIWELFELEGEPKIKDWYVGKTARAIIEITDDIFQIGENYIVLYACDKVGDFFECNDNKWMLTYFRVMPEEDYDVYVIETDIGDFEFLTSRREKRTLAGEEMKIFIAEYITEDDDKATVEVAKVSNKEQAKRALKELSKK